MRVDVPVVHKRDLPKLRGWVDSRNVAQRMKALKHVWERLPAEAYEALQERLRDTIATMSKVIYLAPVLETVSFDEVVDTVAHELAHVYHKHAESDSTDPVEYTRHEREAQRTVRMWGFAMKGERPYER